MPAPRRARVDSQTAVHTRTCYPHNSRETRNKPFYPCLRGAHNAACSRMQILPPPACSSLRSRLTTSKSWNVHAASEQEITTMSAHAKRMMYKNMHRDAQSTPARRAREIRCVHSARAARLLPLRTRQRQGAKRIDNI